MIPMAYVHLVCLPIISLNFLCYENWTSAIWFILSCSLSIRNFFVLCYLRSFSYEILQLYVYIVIDRSNREKNNNNITKFKGPAAACKPQWNCYTIFLKFSLMSKLFLIRQSIKKVGSNLMVLQLARPRRGCRAI